MNLHRLMQSARVGAFALLFLSVAHADFKSDYLDGVDAFESGNYRLAVEKLEAAIAQNPESADRVRLSGTRFFNYMPHFYLGQAYFKQNNCSSAVAAWNQEIKMSVVQGRDEYAALQRDLKTCQSQVVDVSTIAQAAAEEIGLLESAVKAFAQLENDKNLAAEWSARWAPELSRGNQLTQALQDRLKKARSESDPVAIEAITQEAKEGAGKLANDTRQAKAQSLAIQNRLAEQQRLASEKSIESEKLAKEAARTDLTSAIRMAKAAEKPDGGNSDINNYWTELNRAVTTGENLASTASTANIKDQTQVINNVLRRYNLSVQDWRTQQQNVARRTPPPDLKTVAEVFFAGDYKRAVDLASPDLFDDNRAKIQALLFRAAANHKLYMRSGEKDVAALRQAQTDIRAIKRLSSSFSPYIAAFSPSFLSLFRQTG